LELSKEKNDLISEGLDNLAIAKSYLDTKRPEEAIPYLKEV